MCYGFFNKNRETSSFVRGHSSPPEGTGDVRYRFGEPVDPMEITYEIRLDPEGYAYEVSEKYGINLKGSGQEITIKYNLDLVSAGKSRKATPTVIEVGHVHLLVKKN